MLIGIFEHKTNKTSNARVRYYKMSGLCILFPFFKPYAVIVINKFLSLQKQQISDV